MLTNPHDDHEQRGLPKLYTLKEAAEAFGTSGITVKSLRREVNADRIRCVRTRPGRNAKILIAEHELLRWLEEDAGARQHVYRSADQTSKAGDSDPARYTAQVAERKAVHHGG